MSENSWLPALLADLRSRGITFVMKGNALKVRPWKMLTRDEASTVQANRAALKDLVRAEKVAPPSTAPVWPTCPYCHRACVGPEHPAYSVMHYTDPFEVKKRDEYSRRVMLKMMPRGHDGIY